MRLSDYMIVQESALAAATVSMAVTRLEHAVTYWLCRGWSCAGGVSTVNVDGATHLFQTLTKPTPQVD